MSRGTPETKLRKFWIHSNGVVTQFVWGAMVFATIGWLCDDRRFCVGLHVKGFNVGLSLFDRGFDWVRYAYVSGWEFYWMDKTWESIRWEERP